MEILSISATKAREVTLAMTFLVAVLFPTLAGAVFIGPNDVSNEIRFATEPVLGDRAGGPVFTGPNPAAPLLPRELVGVGNNYPDFGVPNLPLEGHQAGNANPTSASAPANAATGFGGGFTNMVATTFFFGNGAGLFWTNFLIVDDPIADGTASTNVSQQTGTFIWDGPLVEAVAFVTLGIRAFGLVAPESFVETALAAEFIITDPLNPANPQTFEAFVAIAGNPAGPRPLLLDDGFIGVPGPNPASTSFFMPLPDGFLAGEGLLFGPLPLAPNAIVQLNATLSLKADPAVIEIFDPLPFLFPGGLPQQPILAAGSSPTLVPQPSTLALLLASLLVVGWSSRSRKRTTRSARHNGGMKP